MLKGKSISSHTGSSDLLDSAHVSCHIPPSLQVSIVQEYNLLLSISFPDVPSMLLRLLLSHRNAACGPRLNINLCRRQRWCVVFFFFNIYESEYSRGYWCPESKAQFVQVNLLFLHNKLTPTTVWSHA